MVHIRHMRLWRKIYSKLKDTISTADLSEEVQCPFCDGEGTVMHLRRYRENENGDIEKVELDADGSIDLDRLKAWDDFEEG